MLKKNLRIWYIRTNTTIVYSQLEFFLKILLELTGQIERDKPNLFATSLFVVFLMIRVCLMICGAPGRLTFDIDIIITLSTDPSLYSVILEFLLAR